MKRLTLAVVALSMFAIPAIEAQAASSYMPQPAGAQRSDLAKVAQRDAYRNKTVVKKHVEQKRVVKKKAGHKDWNRGYRDGGHWNGGHRNGGHWNGGNEWKRGQKYSAWKRHQSVRDWHRHGLRRPAHGQEWIRVGNDYLLVGIATGIIAGMIAAN